jgi:hypothetical protein
MGAKVTVILQNEREVETARRAWNELGLSSQVTFHPSGRLPDDNERFDLVWNFNAIPRIEEPSFMVDRMLELSSKHVLLFASNRLNYGFPVHRLHHMVAGEDWYHGDVTYMSTRSLEKLVRQSGGRVIRSLIVDIPWWPDID